jgi:heparanase 1
MRPVYTVLLLPLGLGLAIATAPGHKDQPAVVHLRVDSGRQVFEVSPAFVSYTIDSAAVCDKTWTFPSNVDAVTTARVRLLSDPGLVIRFGGTSADNEQLQAAGTPMLPRLSRVENGYLGQDGCNITAPQWWALAEFAASVNASLVYGLDSLLRQHAQPEGAIDLRNADGLLSLAAEKPLSLFGLELGNEPLAWSQQHYTNLTAAQHAADFAPLRKRIAAHFGGKTGQLPRTIGPDVYGLTRRGGSATAYLRDFLAARPPVDIVTIHLYSLMDGKNISADVFYNSTRLDFSRRSASAARAIIDAAPGLGPETPLWVGEGSPSWKLICDHGCGALGRNITYELAYLDMLGSFARSRVALFARQCLNSVLNPETDTTGGATPGYWTGILWKRLMGNAVFNATVSDNATAGGEAAAGDAAAGVGLRAYAHRTPHTTNGVTLLLLNLNDATILAAPTFAGLTNAPIDAAASLSPSCARYTLSAGPSTLRGDSVMLNGRRLDFSSKNSTSLPDMDGVATECSNVTLPPHSATWLVVAPLASQAS